MADLQQTPLGWRTIAQDGSQIHLPEDVARDVFPDFFEDAPQPAVQLPLPEPEPAPVVADPNQHRPPIADKLAQGQLPAGASGASYSYSGTRPQPKAKRGLIDVESAGQLGNQLSEQAIAGADQATDAQAAKYGAQLELDQAMRPFADERLRMAHEFEAAEAERHNRASEELAAHEQRIAEAIAAVPQENPGRYWQNLDGFTSGIATLTMMMGSLAGGGKSNQVADFALQLVDRDLRAQEANIATAKAKVGFEQDAYARSSQQSYYDKLDLQEMKALKLETLASGMEQTAAGFKSKFTQAEFLEQAAKIRMERDKVLADIAQQRQAAMMDAMKTNLTLQEQRADRKQRADQFKESMQLEKDKLTAKGNEKAAQGLLVGRATGFNRNGESFEVPGISETDKAKNHEEFRRRGQGAATALGALRDLKSMSFEKFSSLSPEQKTEFQAAMSKVVLGQAEASGYSVSKSSDKDMEMFKAAAGGDMSLMKGMFDEDGKVRKDVIANAVDDVVASQNMFAKSWGDETVGYEAPAWAKELRVNAVSPAEALNKVQQTQIIPGTSGTDATSSTVANAQRLLSDAKAGKWDHEPEALMGAAVRLRDVAADAAKSANPAVREKAKEAAQLSLDLAEMSATRMKEAKTRSAMPKSRVVGGGGRQSVMVERTSPEMLSDDELRARGFVK